ncbi:uncharacterized protein GGS22DRAFT_198476 [Annulohypoxylon maeteangense]|uniref:uncharacterized protein n=1 Tax=Annulohypoxylon maeteangense TaxID=1927788 RepID=UPI0020082540|nr:uncharacterized protein GGS22DRAFT_198476 [Annulohypoxylon maeteangense]KAI0879946.1 hypothetical protein GGS22DRAFT_198476 [Annulohypoxylon maeteangense]
MTTSRSGAKSEPASKKDCGEDIALKHQLDTKGSPESKRTKKNDGDKKQQTIEDTLPSPTGAYGDGTNRARPNSNKKGEDRNDHHDTKCSKKSDQIGSAEQRGERQGVVPSNILEKGIVYFFIRGRVGIDVPSSVYDIRRSYIVLRPLSKDAKPGKGTIDDAGNSRLIAIPKKVLPSSGKDRWIAFVEKAHASFQTLKDKFISASDYATKTAGVRHTPAATPIAEGIYAITSTGRESHLVYMITLPVDLGEVQKKIGLKDKGSFIVSTRNPQYEAPKGAALPQGPDYPKEIQDEFRALRWFATQPKHLDFVNTQFLLIGESNGIKKATEVQKDQKEGQEKPVEELEKLEEEDTHRMESLRGDDSAAIFADLQAHAKDHPRLQTTF